MAAAAFLGPAQRAFALLALQEQAAPTERALARALWPVAFGACADRELSREIVLEEVRARLQPRGVLRPRWCPRHDFERAPLGCVWCSSLGGST